LYETRFGVIGSREFVVLLVGVGPAPTNRTTEADVAASGTKYD